MTEPGIGDQVRAMLRAQDRACLATCTASEGVPYASLVMVACDHDGAPLLLLSDLADHTKNIQANPAASLLIDTTFGRDDPLTGARVTLLGRIKQQDGLDPKKSHAMQRFVRRHASAAFYGGFTDFNLYRMSIERAHLVAGFGKIHWAEQPGLSLNQVPAALVEAEAEIVAHMNEDHCDAVGLYANRLLGLDGVGWRLTGIDPEGADLRRGSQVARIAFEKLVEDAEAARSELVRLVKQARRLT